MKISFAKTGIDAAPKGYLRVRFTEEQRGTKRVVRESDTEWLELGIGKPKELTNRKFIVLIRSLVQAAKHQGARRIAVSFDATPELWKNLSFTTEEQSSRLFAENAVMANFEFRTFKTKPREGWKDVEEILVFDAATPQMRAGVKKGLLVGEAVNAARELSNTPGGDMTPQKLAKAAKAAVSGLPVTVTTLGRAQMQKLGMGALLGVAQGSSEEPTFTVMEYKGGPGKPIVIAGKGITFDSGGLNLKPSNGIYEMHMDMSGAAAVIHTVALAARLGLKKRVIGLVPSAENMPGNNAYRPGDVLKSMSGKTIEVLNTDAEGRLILADAITYAKRLAPSVMLDVATLTGASIQALGFYASGLMTRDDALADTLSALAEESGDYVWRLPLWDEYEASIKGTFADLSNIGTGPSKGAGATEGGMFLWQFAKELDCPWAHLDIAPRMTAAPGEELAKGAAGAPVRLLISFIEAWKA